MPFTARHNSAAFTVPLPIKGKGLNHAAVVALFTIAGTGVPMQLTDTVAIDAQPDFDTPGQVTVKDLLSWVRTHDGLEALDWETYAVRDALQGLADELLPL